MASRPAIASLTWTDLETRFRALQGQLHPMREQAWMRIDYQWGAAGENWSVVASAGHAATVEFETLCTIAGDLLLTLPATAVAREALAEPKAKHRWYLALWHHMTSKVPDHKAFAGPDDKIGTIFTGRIREPVELSATLCLQFSTVDLAGRPLAQVPMWSRMSRWVTHQYNEHGALWALVGFFVGLAVAVLALILGR